MAYEYEADEWRWAVNDLNETSRAATTHEAHTSGQNWNYTPEEIRDLM